MKAWIAVDDYIDRSLAISDADWDAALAANAAASLPPIDVSAGAGQVPLPAGPRHRGTTSAVQTVGAKDWDGFLIAVVD